MSEHWHVALRGRGGRIRPVYGLGSWATGEDAYAERGAQQQASNLGTRPGQVAPEHWCVVSCDNKECEA